MCELGRKRLRPVWVEEPQLLSGHLERIRRLERRPNDEPERVRLGVVEQLTHALGIDVNSGQRIKSEQLPIHAHAPAAFKKHVELGLLGVAVTG